MNAALNTSSTGEALESDEAPGIVSPERQLTERAKYEISLAWIRTALQYAVNAQGCRRVSHDTLFPWFGRNLRCYTLLHILSITPPNVGYEDAPEITPWIVRRFLRCRLDV
jgi:hypothetical protein